MPDGEKADVGDASSVIEEEGDVKTVRVIPLSEADAEDVTIGLLEEELCIDDELLVEGGGVRDMRALIDCRFEPDVDAHAVRLPERVANIPELVADVERDASDVEDGVH
jgi:hypothetical protein